MAPMNQQELVGLRVPNIRPGDLIGSLSGFRAGDEQVNAEGLQQLARDFQACPAGEMAELIRAMDVCEGESYMECFFTQIDGLDPSVAQTALQGFLYHIELFYGRSRAQRHLKSILQGRSVLLAMEVGPVLDAIYQLFGQRYYMDFCHDCAQVKAEYRLEQVSGAKKSKLAGQDAGGYRTAPQFADERKGGKRRTNTRGDSLRIRTERGQMQAAVEQESATAASKTFAASSEQLEAKAQANQKISTAVARLKMLQQEK